MYIRQTHSTNTLLREMLTRGEWPQDEFMLRAGFQTAGRGQAGNGWESEPDRNLLFSVLLRETGVKPENQFDISVAISVALYRVVHEILPRQYREHLTIKWPNDLYYGDRKLAGILVENAMEGNRLAWSIGGIGLNVNQTEWKSDAPNPISLKQITGAEYDLTELADAYARALINNVLREPREQIWAEYKQHLYRRTGFWPFVERAVSTTPTMNADQNAEGQFMARIADITPQGEIVLEDQNGQQRTYHFKQVRYVI